MKGELEWVVKYVVPEEARTKLGNLRYLEQLRVLARRNRKNPTEAESKFWQLLSYKKLNLKFLRQKPVGRFIIDFYCSKLLLAVEIDGDVHDNQQNRDQGRDLYLEQRGIKTIRYRNEEVLAGIWEIKQDLIMKINQRKIELNPPFVKGG